MANVTKATVVVRPAREKVVYTLTLSEAEAETVAAVMGRVSGDVMDSPRSHTDNISNALREAGVLWFGRRVSNSLSGNVHFD